MTSPPSGRTVLVLNVGSSSVKFALVDSATGDRPVQGSAERIGTPQAVVHLSGAAGPTHLPVPGADHARCVQRILDELGSDRTPHPAPTAVGHRVVHGGRRFSSSVLIDDEVVRAIDELSDLAPLHNPPALAGIRAVRAAYPDLPQVAVFDTAFHHTLPARAYRYAVPEQWYEEYDVRRYGFHGTSFRYVVGRASELLGRPLAELDLVVAHLGNGCSAAAVHHGESVDTTMGLTPLEGLVMGSRSGDVDPGLFGYLSDRAGLTANETTTRLNSESGLKALSGRTNDLREISEAADAGDERARLALDVFVHRLAKSLAGLATSLDRVDALVFTGGIGEHSAPVRRRTLARLGFLGLELDETANLADGRDTHGRIAGSSSAVALVVPTDEERLIAQDTAALTAGAGVARTLLAVPIGTRVGLTSACLGLLRALDRRGVHVGYVKPLAQPNAEDVPDRSAELVRALTALEPPDPVPVATVEELLGTGALDTVLEEVVGRWRPVRDEYDLVVVEGLNPGPTHSYSGQANQAMARALDADVLLVGSWPEATHQTHAAEAEHLAESLAIAARNYSIGEDLRVIGCVVNRLPDAEVRDLVRDALARRGRRLVAGSLFRADLTAPRVRDLVEELDLTVLSAGDPDRRITDVAVFAQAIPGGLRVLTEGRLVVVPGDRHDVVMAACLTALNGVPLAALLLTAGIEPDPQVWELTRAALDTGLPVLLTAAGTYESAVAVRDLDVDLSAEDPGRAETVMAHGADAYAEDWLGELAAERGATRLSPAAFRYQLTELARAAGARIVLPEGTEPRTVRAAAICAERGIARPVLLGAPEEVRAVARTAGVVLPDSVEIIDPDLVAEDYVADLYALRRAKGWTEEMARERLGDAIMVGTMMLQRGEVAGLVSGAEHTTADTVRPALQVIGTRPGASLVSSVFFMCLPDQVLVYGDCAINPQPTAEELADIAVQSAESARAFGIEPRVAMISFSTGESGAGSDVAKVAAATALVRERAPGLAVDGPLQYDAASSMSVGRSKRPGSAVAGRATVFIFPDLDTGNTTYKAVQRSADVISVGPLLQGLAKPVNDLSRGALVEDIVYTVALTAIQASAG